ncbi:MAG: hypothetical protein ABI210_15145 [Abditibacteriaceae bacterium]
MTGKTAIPGDDEKLPMKVNASVPSSQPIYDWLDSTWDGVSGCVGGAFGIWFFGGCLSELLAIVGIGSGVGCGFCLAPIIIIILLLWACWWILSLLAPVFWILFFCAPSIYFFIRWVSSRHTNQYKSWEELLSGWFGLGASESTAFSFFVALLIWGLIQVPYSAVLIICFPHHP